MVVSKYIKSTITIRPETLCFLSVGHFVKKKIIVGFDIINRQLVTQDNSALLVTHN